MYISSLKVDMFHLPLFLHLSVRYMLTLWYIRLCSHYFYPHLAEHHWSISNISILMKVKYLQGSQNWWRHCWRRNPGTMKHKPLQPAHVDGASFSFWYYFFSIFTTIYLHMESMQLRIAAKRIFWKKYMSDAFWFRSRILYLKWWNNNKCAASDDLFINLF